jgi:uncharacterized protein
MNENIWKSKWSKDQIKMMLTEQFVSFQKRPTGIRRTQLAKIESASHSPHAIIISGLRRVGKSTLLSQQARLMEDDSFYYLNFEDERFLGFQADDINELYRHLIELFGERKIFILDEVQNIAGWELFVRRFMDLGHKFYITGSNASLMSQELGTRLTGRFLPIELFPFSFPEFLRFRGYSMPGKGQATTVDQGLLKKNLNEYLQCGGIPEPLQYPELPLLRTLYDDILYRDIATRYRIGDVRALKDLSFYLMSNPSSLVSFNKLKQQFHLGSVNTIKNYFDFLENSWLFFTVNVWDYSVKRQQIAPKKVYCIDTGFLNAIGFAFSPNTGKQLENLVFLALRRQTDQIYYIVSPQDYEVDFYLPETRELIQVTQSMVQPLTRQREIRALADALHRLNLSHGLILTEHSAPAIEKDGISIEIRSIADWLIERS